MSPSFHPLATMSLATIPGPGSAAIARTLPHSLLSLWAAATTHLAIAAEPVPSSEEWRARSLATIASRRTAALTVEVVDAQGFPVPGARVSIDQRRSEFRWALGGSTFVANPDAAPMPAAINSLSVSAAEAAPEGALAVFGASAAGRGLNVRAAWPPRVTQAQPSPPWADVIEWEVPNDLASASKADAIRTLRQQTPFARVLLAAPDVLEAPTRQPLAALRQEALRLGGEDRGVDGLATVVRMGKGDITPQEWLARLDEGASVQPGGATLTWHVTAVLPDAPSPDAIRRCIDLLHVAHGHPAVTGITLLGEGGQAPSLDAQGSGSEFGKAWSQLVGTTWSTRTNLPSSAQGLASVRVFRGEHDVVVEHAGTRVASTARVLADATVRLVLPVVPPTLAAQPGDLVQFTWPADANGYVLESAAHPFDGPWTPCETFAVRGKSGWRQAYGASSTPRYFRLRRGGPR